MDIEGQKKYEAREAFNKIAEMLSNKYSTDSDGVFRFYGYKSNKGFKAALDNLITRYIEIIGGLIDLVEPDELEFIKKNIAKKLSAIEVNVDGSQKNKYWSSDHLIEYKKFRTVQLVAKERLLKYIQKDFINKYRTKKFTWLGNQRQLIELFDKLITKGWILNETDISQALQCLPIVETFNVRLEGKDEVINHESFSKQWQLKTTKGYNYRNPDPYENVFFDLPFKEKTSKK